MMLRHLLLTVMFIGVSAPVMASDDCYFSAPSTPGNGNLHGGGASEASINGLDADFQNNLSALIAAANARFGGNLAIYSGYRSVERQAELYEEALARYGSEAEARRWVAPPGNSMHNFGMAVDMSFNGSRIEYGSAISDWLADNLSNYGLTRPLSNEGWHIEPIGARENARGAASDAANYAGGEACDISDTVQDLPEIFLMPWDPDYPIGALLPGAY